MRKYILPFALLLMLTGSLILLYIVHKDNVALKQRLATMETTLYPGPSVSIVTPPNGFYMASSVFKKGDLWLAVIVKVQISKVGTDTVEYLTNDSNEHLIVEADVSGVDPKNESGFYAEVKDGHTKILSFSQLPR